MRSPNIPSRALSLSALPLLLSLTACGLATSIRPTRAVTIPPERTEQVPGPSIPQASATCAFDPTRLCYTDADAAQVLRGYDGALAEANRRLSWVHNFSACMANRRSARRCDRELEAARAAPAR